MTSLTHSTGNEPSVPAATEEGYLERLRRAEFETVSGFFRPGLRVLELGGGSGFQAALIAGRGCDVLSLDLAGREPSPRTYYPVQDYDGSHLPVTDGSVDLVYSSNVLEHIPDLETTLREIQRALAPGGIALHLLPSPAWRFWTSAAHFGFLLKFALGLQRVTPATSQPTTCNSALRRHGFLGALKRALLIPFYPHGEYPNAIAELYYFSRLRWRRVFEASGFTVVSTTGNNLFYTPYDLLPGLRTSDRRLLAGLLGSSCNVFVLRPSQPAA